MSFRAGGRCPLEGCTFEFAIGSEDERELDLVGQAVLQAHSDYAHEGLPVNLFGIPVDPPGTEQDDDEERPRLIN